MKINQTIKLVGENIPYKVRGVSVRYIVCTRKLDKVEDYNLLEFEVTRGCSNSVDEAYEKHKDHMVYTIIDLNENIRGTHNLVFNPYEFKENEKGDEDIQKLIDDLLKGEIEISHRNRIEFYGFDV